MSTLSVISGISTASAFIGLLSLISYWLTARQFQQKERSIRAVVEGDGVIDTDHAVDILGQFRDETWKLQALRVLVDLDLQKATTLLQKVKSRVDLTRFNAHALRARLLTLKISAATSLVIAGFGLVYSLANPQGTIKAEADNSHIGAAERSNAPAIPIIINNNIAPAPTAESTPRLSPSNPAGADSRTTPPLAHRDSPSLTHAGPGGEEPTNQARQNASDPAAGKTPPRPLRHRAEASSPRCESLLQRSSLGDSLSPDEQTELRNCT